MTTLIVFILIVTSLLFGILPFILTLSTYLLWIYLRSKNIVGREYYYINYGFSQATILKKWWQV